MEKKKFIHCPACKERSFIREKKAFDGFKLIGEINTCAMCGYEFKPDEKVEYLSDRPIFDDDEDDKKSCMRCDYYVENPLTQKCMLHRKEVTALDTCPDFKEKEE